jgi:hypothetical protein
MRSRADRALARALRTALDPTSVNVFKLLGYEPTLDRSSSMPARRTPCFWAGHLEAAKARPLTAETLRAAVQYPGIRIGAFRRTFDELSESLLAELANFDFAEALGAQWNKSTHTLTFPNESIVRFRYCETVEDASRRQGGQYQLVVFDEAAWCLGKSSKRSRSGSAPETPISRCSACALRLIPGIRAICG